MSNATLAQYALMNEGSLPDSTGLSCSPMSRRRYIILKQLVHGDDKRMRYSSVSNREEESNGCSPGSALHLMNGIRCSAAINTKKQKGLNVFLFI